MIEQRIPRWSDDIWLQVRDASGEAMRAKRDVQELIKNYPLAATLTSLAIGVVIGWIVKRR